MARGPKKHLKRINAPRSWMLDKIGGVFAPRPSCGPHKLRNSLPLVVILRNRLKYALNYHEVVKIVMQRTIKIDNKVRTDKTYPTGLMGKFALVAYPHSSIRRLSLPTIRPLSKSLFRCTTNHRSKIGRKANLFTNSRLWSFFLVDFYRLKRKHYPDCKQTLPLLVHTRLCLFTRPAINLTLMHTPCSSHLHRNRCDQH
jgi:hypothetical protein